MNLDEVIMTAVIFFGIITFFKIMSSHFLKRKIIKAGHFDKAEILGQNTEVEVKKQIQYDQYPALKWGLVAFFAGVGFVTMEILGLHYPEFKHYKSAMPYGVFFVSVSIGFLLYYAVMSKKMKE